MEDTKQCTKCSQLWPIEVFYKHSKDGNRSNICKYCKGVKLPNEREAWIQKLNLETEKALTEKELRAEQKRSERVLKREKDIALGKSGTIPIKICNSCKLSLPISSYGIRKEKNGILRPRCKWCDSLKAMEWADANPDKAKERGRRYYQNNRYKLLSREAQDKRNKISEETRLRNRVKDRLDSANRRARIKNASPEWRDQESIDLLFKKTKDLESILGIKLHVDHVVPLNSWYVCGLHVHWNLQVLEETINMSKSNSEWPDMPDINDPELRQLAKEFYVTQIN